MTHAHAHTHTHGGGHVHVHGHGCHGHVHGGGTRGLKIALALTSGFLVAEVVGGILSNSLALLADAGHMLTDVAALSLSLFVAWFSRQAVDARKTYGYLRWEILAALVNGAALLVVSAYIVWEAALRLRTPEPVEGGMMLAVAVGGLLVNAAAAWVLRPDASTSLNLRGAWRLVRDAVDVLLEATPAHIPLDAVRAQLAAIPGIESVHDLHVWSVTSNMVAMSAHAIVREPARHQHVLEHVHDAMRLFGIQHVTVQLEREEMFDRELHLHP